MKKILYFEGAGYAPCGEVENCRIRTAFHDNKGNAIYLDISSFDGSDHIDRAIRHLTSAGMVDSCCYIIDEIHGIKRGINGVERTTFNYEKKDILRLVNSLGCNFDKIVVLPKLAGYRVFKSKSGYNYGDQFRYDEKLTERRNEIYQYYYDLEKSEGKRFPNPSVWVDENNADILYLLRNVNGNDTHWTINAAAENWKSTVTQTPSYNSDCDCIAE